MTLTNFVAALTRLNVEIIGTNNDHHAEWLLSSAHGLKDCVLDLIKVNGLWTVTANGEHFAYAHFA